VSTLKTFILIGIVDSFDANFATVELNTNPASNGGAAIAVMPVHVFPCEIFEGKRFYVAKLQEDKLPVVVCALEEQER
jgi:hypothetical protein